MNWLKVSGLILVITILCCQPEEEGYHHIQKIINAIENNHNIQDEIIALKDSCRTDWNRALTLIREHRKDASIRICDSTLTTISAIIRNQKQLEVEKADDLLQELTSSTDMLRQFPFEYNYILSNQSSSIDESQIQFIISQDINTLTSTDLHYYLKILLNLSKRARYNGEFELSLALIHQGISIIRNHDLAHHFNTLNAKFLMTKGITLMSQPKIYESIIPIILNQTTQKFKESKDNSQAKVIEWYHSRLGSNPARGINIKYLDTLDIGLMDKIKLAIDHGDEFIYTLPRKALTYFNYSLSLFEGVECHNLKNLVYEYLGIVHLELNNIAEATRNFKLAENMENCIPSEQNYIRFNNILYRKDYYSQYIPDYSKNYSFDKLKEERFIGKIVIAEDPDHLNDFLAQNALYFFNLYKNETISNSSRIQQLIALMDQTKSRELKSQRRRDEKKIRSRNNPVKQRLLKEVNEFRDTLNYDNPAYEALFHILAQEYIEEAKQPIETDSIPYPEEALKVITNNSNIQLIEYLAYDTIYFGYFYNNQGLQFFEIDYPTLKKAMDDITVRLEAKESIDSVRKELRQILLPGIKIDPTLPLFINPDGMLHSLPFHLLFDHQREINMVIGLEDILERDSIPIEKFNSLLFSYSDPQTVKSREGKSIHELEFGYEECTFINNQLKLTDEQLYAGHKFTRGHLINQQNRELLHISSHASSNQKNRLDNYIIARDNQGKPDSVYAYEIEEWGLSPTVVVLSACNTGIGAYQNGSGTYSVSRAFSANGSKAIIKTLWEVDDRATYKFMIELYDYWLAGNSLGKSLQLTRSLFDNNILFDPKDWASFVLEGNPNIYLN